MYPPGYTGSKAAPPSNYPEKIRPPRPWDEWGPQEQELRLRKGVGVELFEHLEKEKLRRVETGAVA